MTVTPETTTTTTEYPAWQSIIRKAQAERDAKRAEEEAKRREQRTREESEKLSTLLSILSAYDLVGEVKKDERGITDSGRPYIKAHGFTFYYIEGLYENFIGVNKSVPNATMEHLKSLHDNHYRLEVGRNVLIKSSTFAAEIADAIDELPAEAESQAKKNTLIVDDCNERKAKTAEIVQAVEAPTLSEQLADLIRKIARQEIEESHA